MPPMCLANDMMIFYAPRELYTLNVTVMEMICASVCVTSMICFTLELKYRRENPFDSKVRMARHRMGARGHATSFPLPWESLLLELHQTEAAASAADLPWVGEELADKVAILLKTKDEDDPKSLAQLVHQAQVRRSVVVQLIEGAKARGHRAYVSVSMERVRGKAKRLPESGVPPEIVRLLPHDEHLDKVQVQKAATPVEGRTDAVTAAQGLGKVCPNAVVLEKSSQDEGDINGQRIAALRLLAEKLGRAAGSLPEAPAQGDVHADPNAQASARKPGYAVTTGSAMLDQFEPWYFGIAFAFLFKILHRHARHASLERAPPLPPRCRRASYRSAVVGARARSTRRRSTG